MSTATDKRTEYVSLRVSAAEMEFLRQVAVDEDRSVSAVLRLALKEFYERRVDK